jgi:very-short-patch-repair endonuclease
MNKWNEIRRFYELMHSAIMDEPANEWGIDPYGWEQDAGISLTPIEAWLWWDIRALDLVLYPQYPVGRFFVDFANPKAKVAIECDGEQFHQDKEKDAKRDAKLRLMGWTVYRISGKDCRDGVGSDMPAQSEARKFLQHIANNHSIKRR